MKNFDKPPEINPAYVAGRVMERWLERTSPVLTAFDSGVASERKYQTIFSLIYALAVTDSWIQRAEVSGAETPTRESSRVLSFIRSKDDGKNRG